jgi:hypothetical protein
MAISTAMATSFKKELLSGGHCFNGTVAPTGTTSGTNIVSGMSSMVGVVIGMTITDTGNASIPANTTIVSIISSSSVSISQAATGSFSGTALAISGDILKMALIKAAESGTYGTTSVNYSDIVGNSDETSGTGYTSGGIILTNVSPVSSGVVAYIDFSPNPSWTSASFSTTGCMIFNSNNRDGGLSGTNATGNNRCVGVFDFSGTQTVSSGTFTVLMPNPVAATAILRLT